VKDIPAVILCGGTGTRLQEATEFVPKPMIPIGGKPMVWHIMRLYYHYGVRDFVLALGYKQEVFKNYFAHYAVINNDITVEKGQFYEHWWKEDNPEWKVTLSDTGEKTLKGARLNRIRKYVSCAENFFVTYGDGVGNVNMQRLLDFHLHHGKIATVTGIHPKPRFGEIKHDSWMVTSFSEKPENNQQMVNGGFFVFNQKIFDYLHNGDDCDLEIGVLDKLAADGQLMVHPHAGYWGCMDTLPEMHELNKLWREGRAEWKIW
jgi:glucose-1-phosphate cytidylyltransferase